MSSEAVEIRDAAGSYVLQAEQAVPPGYKRTEVGAIPEDWEVCTLGDVLILQRGFDLPTRLRKEGNVPIISSSGISGWHNAAKASGPGIVTGRYGTIGDVFFVESDYWPLNTTLYVRDFRGNDRRYIFYLLQQVDFLSHSGKSGVPGVNRNDVHQELVLLPPVKEQRAIATALSDVDALITALDKLIAKKRAIKTAAMQQLLTGKTRLPGFSGEWETKSLGDIADVSKGKQLSVTDATLKNGYPHFNGGISPSGYANKFNRPANTIVISEGGNSCGFVQFVAQPFWCGGHCYSVLPNGIHKLYLYHALKNLQQIIMELRVGSGLPNVQQSALKSLAVSFPPNLQEQTAIAQTLSDMDAEIAALEACRDKTRAIKQGMMQQLLTGRVRLVKLNSRETA